MFLLPLERARTIDLNLLQELSLKVEFSKTEWIQARVRLGFAPAVHLSPRAAIPQLEKNKDKGLQDLI